MIVTGLVLAVLGVLAVCAVFAIFALLLGTLFAIALMALKVLPFVIIGWIALRLLRDTNPHRKLPAADQMWLDS